MWWYRRKYNLPVHDPRFLNVTMDEIQLDFYAEQATLIRDSGDTSYEDDDFESRVLKMQRDNEDETDDENAWETVESWEGEAREAE